VAGAGHRLRADGGQNPSRGAADLDIIPVHPASPENSGDGAPVPDRAHGAATSSVPRPAISSARANSASTCPISCRSRSPRRRPWPG
jgi:hypothetical protein